MNDQKRIETLQAVMDGKITLDQAGVLLKRSRRQVFRLIARLRSEGLPGLIHKNRGKVSSKKTSKALREKILALVQTRYKDVNDCHLCELLYQRENITIGRETLRSFLRKQGLAPKHKKKRSKYRGRRERKGALGMMIQIDASPHDWLEGRGPWMTLMGGRDDATNHTWARFEKSENLWGYLGLLQSITTSHGLPLSLYSDKHTIFFSPRLQTIYEQLDNTIPLTQFGRACDELGITLIKAHSPQAKGRVERLWGVLQDRLVVEMRLANIQNLDQANRFLETFLIDWNKRFCVSPKETNNVFRKAPPGLDQILCIKETRTVNKDHTVSFEGLILQIPPSKKYPYLAKKKVKVLQLACGEIQIHYKTHTLASFDFATVTRLSKKSHSQVLKRVA